MRFYSLGVYHSTKKEFFEKLQHNKIDVFLDIRRRRGLRGKTYSFANSKKLQEELKKMGVRYIHLPQLAPTQSMIQAQDESDNNHGISRRDREKLTSEFKKAYHDEILEDFELEELVVQLKEEGSKRVVLFCVEELAAGCHRSIVSSQLEMMKYSVRHL